MPRFGIFKALLLSLALPAAFAFTTNAQTEERSRLIVPTTHQEQRIADRTRLLCAGYIRHQKLPHMPEIVGAVEEQEQRRFSDGEVVYINAGSQHNVVPSECTFTVDIRVNELYTFDEVISIIQQNIQSEIAPRSLRLRSTNIELNHPLVKAGIDLERKYYGSPTTSDKALMPFPALKMGPGDSARSHSADEFIFVDEIKEGIELYIQLLNKVI